MQSKQPIHICQACVVIVIDCPRTNEHKDELNSLCHAIFPKDWNSLGKYEQFSISKDYSLNDHVELDKTNSITISNNVVYHKIAEFLN